MAEVMKRAFYDRRGGLGDPDFAKVPTSGLLSKEHLDAMDATLGPKAVPARASATPILPARRNSRRRISRYRRIVVEEAPVALRDDPERRLCGSGVTVSRAPGSPLNNEMDDFAVSPGKPNMFG
jgi:gamma-glutamyltranspeptidase/glutathione hydrolase